MTRSASTQSAAVDDSIAAERGEVAGRTVFQPYDDLPQAEPVAIVRETWVLVSLMRASLSYYADAAERVGHPMVAERHRSELVVADQLLDALATIWKGDDLAIGVSLADEIRIGVDRLNRLTERALSGQQRRDAAHHVTATAHDV